MYKRQLYQFAKDLFLQRVKQAYVDESLPVPAELEQLISLQAIQGGRVINEEGLTSPRPNLLPQSDESQRGNEKEAVAVQFAEDSFQSGQIPAVPGTQELPVGWVDGNFLGSESSFANDKGDAEHDTHSRGTHRLSRKTSSERHDGGHSQTFRHFSKSHQRSRERR